VARPSEPFLQQKSSTAEIAGKAGLLAGGSILWLGLIGLAVGQPVLLASLGPTIYLQAKDPYQESSRFYNVVVGHFIGLLAACMALLALGAHLTPAVFVAHQLTSPRVWAAALAVLIALPAEILLRASHPPSAATLLLIAFGGFNPTLHDATVIIVGVLLTAGIGETIRWLQLRT
jgi:hypothetical protein